MCRMFQIALFAAVMIGAACKKPDKPAGTQPDDTTKVVEPNKAGDPATPAPATPDPAKPGDPPPADRAKPADTAATPGTNTELQAKGVEMMQKMGDIFAANAADCDKLAIEIKNFVATNKALLTQWNAMQRDLSSQERTEFEVRNKSVQDAVMAKMAPAAQTCVNNQNFQAVLREIPTE